MLTSPSKTLLKDCAVSKNKESDQQVFLILYIRVGEIPKFFECRPSNPLNG